MLEQNTDRIYWVIGALLVAAALIKAADTFFPTLMNSATGKITEMFTTIVHPSGGGTPTPGP